MPRRRLHGETQKRRKKPQTRLLKRAETAVRPQATQQPAPFERSPRIEREDLEFLEAMRELDVHRSPRRGESPARRQAVERVQFLAEDAEGALFQRSMAHLGVRPLQGEVPEAPEAPVAARNGPESQAAEPPPPPASQPPEGGPPASAPAGPPTAQPAWEPPAAAHPAASPATGPAPQPAPAWEGTEFESDGEGPALMEALLGAAEFSPELKFAGAVAPPRRRPSRGAEPEDEAEPDDELDLHGKTQEEAIRMVQSFLLVSQRRRLRHVLIITGRGHNSGEHGPVLKDACYRWLEINGKRFVRAFTRAPGRLGGAGAIWVTLR